MENKTKNIKGIVFTNLVDTKEKETSLKGTYAPNSGKPYNLEGAISDGNGFFERNLKHINGALSILQGK